MVWLAATTLGCAVSAKAAFHPSCCPELLCKRNAAGILQCAPDLPTKQSDEPFYEEYRFRFPSDGIVPETLQECRRAS